MAGVCSTLLFLAPLPAQEKAEQQKEPKTQSKAAAGRPSPNRLELAVGSHEDDILHRHFLRATLLDPIQALI